MFLLSHLAFAGEDEVFFETQVRPLLAKHCFECHGEKKQESSVRLDHKSLLFGSTPQTALVTPGNPDESRLWQVIVYSDSDIQMPPAAPISEEEKGVLKTWIERGAYWPEETNPASLKTGIPRHSDGSIDFVQAVEQHWAYRPIENPAVPAPQHPEQCQTEIDRFVAARLDEAGLQFSSPASRETLIRRLTLDLHGIPPTFAEVQAFVQNTDENAVEQLIDQLLASPLYGQRWGRYWLDIARYADTKGYVFQEDRNFAYSYTYRDYVIDALNEDKPYNDFIREQLAADLLNLPENDPRLAALGFITVGPRFLNRQDDIIDDRIDLVTRGLLGMTVACARCHDHKYDPVPTADYYALYGVFQSTHEPELGPLIGNHDLSTPEAQAFQQERDKRLQEVENFAQTSHQDLLQQAVDQLEDLIPSAAKQANLLAADLDLQLTNAAPRVKLIEHWRKVIDQLVAANHPAMRAWGTLMALPEDGLAQPDNEALALVLNDPELPAPLLEALRASPPRTRLDLVRIYSNVLQQVVSEWKQARMQDPMLEHLPDTQKEVIRSVIYGPGSLTDLPASQKSPLFETDQRDRLTQLRANVTAWDNTSPDAPPRAMVLKENDTPAKPVVFIRGNPGRRGDEVTKHAPRILDPEQEVPFQNGSGRLELAEKIVAQSNPLTSRVIVNRVWSKFFDAGLVESASDFGSRSSPPTHPELLDYLAWTFMHQDHWSLKSLHKRILLSAVYQQASVDRPEARLIDSENSLLWRQNRKRMDFEAMRDSTLFVAGQLDTNRKKRSFNIETETNSPHRTIYATIDRNNLPGVLRTFDFPAPEYSSPGRPKTTVPQQALFAMNSPFAYTVAEQLAGIISKQTSNPREQAQLLIERVYSRPATPDEIQQLTLYLKARPLNQLAQALLMTNEFLFVD